MSALVSAVGTDTYGGLSGYKRPTAGNPTRVPSNLPAFRGVNNKPGSNIKAPAIKSSANHPDRKTNVQIPYARVVPVEFPASLGRLSPGDVAFVSKSRPGLPGYACAYQTRLIGVDALNKFMGPNYWSTKIEVGDTFRYILLDAARPADDWRRVPSLQEWTLDGVVQGSEERELFYNAADGRRENQLYNIAIQGPTMLNNGYVEEHQGWDEIARVQQGQIAREQQTFSGSYMDHRVEKFGPHGEMEVDQQWDFAANYQGPQYHLYPQQMFDRSIRPLNKLYIGLVCAEYRFDATSLVMVQEVIKAQKEIAEAVDEVNTLRPNLGKKQAALAAATVQVERFERVQAAIAAADVRKNDATLIQSERDAATQESTKLKAQLKLLGSKADVAAAKVAVATLTTEMATAKANVRQLKDDLKQLIVDKPNIPNAVRAKTAWEKMNWWNDDGGIPKVPGTDGAPKESFCAFRYVLFTSSQLDELNLESAANPSGVGMMAPKGEPVLRTKRQKLGNDPYDDDAQRQKDFRHMVGAWHVGSVLDMKAGKMPWFEGGPADTGFRVTANVNVHWCDWRDLRREYTPTGSPVQVADLLTGSPQWKKDSVKPIQDGAILQWPTRFYGAKEQAEAKRTSDATGDDEVDVTRNNVPIDPNEFYKGNDTDRDGQINYYLDIDEDDENPNDFVGPDGANFDLRGIQAAIRKGRFARLAVLEPRTPGARLHHSVHIERAGTAINNLKMLLAPITAEEIAAYRANTALPPVARYVMADPPSAAPEATSAPAAQAAPLRRRAGNTPEPSPDRSGAVAPVGGAAAAAASDSGLAPIIEAPGAASGSAAPMVIEAPGAPAAPAAQNAPAAAGRKRRTGGTDDVFSTIFGGSSTDAPMQPLNPQHRSDAGGSSGRSYQRRSKGGGAGGSKS